MNELLNFFLEHWLLSGLLVVLLISFIRNEINTHSYGATRVSAQEVTELMNHKDALIIDIRSSDAYARGHIIGAKSMPSQQFQQALKNLKADKNKPVILSCATGQESPKYSKQLKAAGYERAYVLAGGLGAWQAAGMPLVKK